MTKSEIENSMAIWKLAKQHISDSKKESDVGKAIEITDRESAVEQFLRERGFPIPES